MFPCNEQHTVLSVCTIGKSFDNSTNETGHNSPPNHPIQDRRVEANLVKAIRASLGVVVLLMSMAFPVPVAFRVPASIPVVAFRKKKMEASSQHTPK